MRAQCKGLDIDLGGLNANPGDTSELSARVVSLTDAGEQPVEVSTIMVAQDGAIAANLIFTTLDDVVDATDGELSLREAVALANGSEGLDCITFADDLTGRTITLTGGQLEVTDALIIDGDIDDGGPTPTVALLDSATNPALNLASPGLDTDQRGIARDETPESDAFELGVAPPANLIALDDTAETRCDRPVTIAVLVNDDDGDNDPETVPAITAFDGESSNRGSVVLTDDGTLTYAPAEGFVGTDTFTYTITDGKEESTTTVVIEVTNAAPVAANDSALTTIDNPVSIDVLMNDDDPDDCPQPMLSIVKIDDVFLRGGSIVIDDDGLALYAPPGGFAGSDQFNYTISHGAATDDATVNVRVNRPPQAVSDNETTTSGVAVRLNVLRNDNDADGSLEIDSLLIIDEPNNGIAEVSGGDLIYTLNERFGATDSHTY